MSFPCHPAVNWNPKYKELLGRYLRDVGKAELSGQKQTYTIHEKHWDSLEKEWGNAMGWIKSKSSQRGIGFLTGKKHDVVGVMDADHVSLWNRNGKPVAIVSQPYCDRTYDSPAVVGDLDKFEALHGLKRQRVPYSGWHNYPRTHLDVWTKSE
ncbi:hypothetical protein DS909_17745 [Phaeobacter gallaeciensis]|uniref:Uncharacterized protein n=1 Tax=Phaeobacter gallaeciensis TaxID=60890 RepID=A0A366WSF2_9RHOB|nr:hypothetical protein DS909_17745 [Phaeobacter gallaeciensis]